MNLAQKQYTDRKLPNIKHKHQQTESKLENKLNLNIQILKIKLKQKIKLLKSELNKQKIPHNHTEHEYNFYRIFLSPNCAEKSK